MSATATDDLARLAEELRRLHHELTELELTRRAEAAARVRAAVQALDELRSSTAILERSGAELAASAGLDRVILGRVGEGRLTVLVAWPEAADVAGRAFPLAYPLLEDEVARNQRAALVDPAASGGRAAPALADVLPDRYVIAPLVVEGSTIGLLHAARAAGGRPLDADDAGLVAAFAAGLARAFERAVLREQVGRRRAQLEEAAAWIAGQIGELERPGGPEPPEAGLRAGLTPRELEVLRLIADGRSNRAIATTLALSEGTVKYHVKNVLRKLQARSRTEAVSRYMQSEGMSP